MRNLCILLLFSSTLGFAQNWTLNLMVDPNPSPYVGDWETDPTMGMLELTNTGTEADVVIIYAEVTDGSGYVGFRGNSGRLLVNAGEMMTINNTQFRDWYTDYVDSEWESRTTRTGMIPEHDYEVRLWVKNLWNETLVDHVVEYFTIRHPEPPELIYPNQETVDLQYPVFQWLPVQTGSGSPFYYHLRIVELLPGQTPQLALEANYPHYENSLITESNFEYPLDALPLENNTTFIWQVRAVTAEGLAATKNDGRSELGSFTTEFDASLPELQLLEPMDQGIVTTPTPAFQWMEPLLSSGEYIYYTVHVCRILAGQDAEMALAMNPPVFVNDETLTEPELSYPVSATELVPGYRYAWQVQARNAFGDPLVANDGKSPVWTFTVSHTSGDDDLLAFDAFPERLPLLGESIAYLQLRQGNQVYSEYSFSDDSSLVTLTGNLLLCLPGLAPGSVADPIACQGHLVFNRHTLEIIDGSVQASVAPAENSVLNIDSHGLPFIIHSLTFDSSQPEHLSCQAVPMLFDEIFRPSETPLRLESDGRLTGQINLVMNETVGLVSESDMLTLDIQSIHGLVDLQPGVSVWQDELTLEGDVNLTTETATLHHRVELILDKQGAQLQTFFPDQGSVRFTLDDFALELADMQCNQLQYRPDLQVWMFDFTFNAAMHFTDLGLSLPPVKGVHMGRFGIELPQISHNNLSTDSFLPLQGVIVRPVAFRMYPYTFDLFHAQLTDLENIGLFFDLDILLDLPMHMDDLITTPFRATNAKYIGGQFVGPWNARTFDPPVFISLKDQSHMGLTVRTVQGEFPASGDASQTVLNVGATFTPDDRLAFDPSKSIDFLPAELQLSVNGFWQGKKPISQNDAIRWTPDLQIVPSSQTLVFSAQGDQQLVTLDLSGYINIPAFSGTTVRAAGSGRFDLLQWRFIESSFTTLDAFTLGLPADNPLFGLHCPAGARLDAQGLHIPAGTNSLTLNDQSQVDCDLLTEMIVALPDWKTTLAETNIQSSFALDISRFGRGGDGMNWQSMSLDHTVTTDMDHLLMALPADIRLLDDELVATGNSTAQLQMRDQSYDLDSRYSHDFHYALSENQIKRGWVDFFIDSEKVAVLDSSGFHPGNYFGGLLVASVIALPDSEIAYIDLKENEHLTLNADQGAVLVQSPANRPAKIRFPSLQYQASSIPVIDAEINIQVNPNTALMESGTIKPVGDPILSLDSAGVALKITALTYESGAWKATLQPILPMALASSQIGADNVTLGKNGLAHFDQGYMPFASAPRDSVNLGPNLKVTLDGVRGVMGSSDQQVSVSGDFKSPMFQNQRIHFTAQLSPDSATFDLKTLNLDLPLGCGSVELFEHRDLPRVVAPMQQADLALHLAGKLKLPGLSQEFVLSLPRIEISGQEIKTIELQFQDQAQSLGLFGTELLIERVGLEFPALDHFNLMMNGSILFFGKAAPFSGLTILDDCSLKDTTLTSLATPLSINEKLTLSHLAVQNGNLEVRGDILLPDPFDAGNEQEFALSINSQGEWLDHAGEPLESNRLDIELTTSKQVHRIVLGTEEFNVGARLSAMELGLTGTDLAQAQGYVGLDLDTIWPGNYVNSRDDSTLLKTTGRFEFNQDQWSDSWLISDEISVDTVYSVLDNDLFMHAASFSMADTSGFRMLFNADLELPLPPGIMTGEIELLDNQLGRELFDFGKLHTGQISLSGVTLELLDFHYVRNGTVSSSEIEFSQTSASVTEKEIQTDLYLSFGAYLSTSLPGFEAGVERFVIFKSDSLFNLLIQGANLWIGDYIYAGLDLLGSIEWANSGTRFRWLLGGHLDMDLGQIQGAAVVGEVSYREVINVSGKPENSPGFGLMLAVKTDIDLTPLPLSIKGLGAGFFWNPSPEIRDLVAGHLGFTGDVNEEFQAILDENDDDMMTLWEIYLYGEAAIPDDYYLQAKALLTLATDRIRLDAKGWPADSTAISEFLDLSGWISAECAWRQDFSGFKHLAGHIELGGRPATDSKMILKLPTNNVAKIDFILLGNGRFAMSGYLLTTIYSSLTVECDFTFGNPGLVFSGTLSYGFDVWIVYAEAGMEITVFLKWEDPKVFGGYASLWVQGGIIDDWLASFRGEMGAAIMGAPDFMLYGYAELTGTIVGISKTVRVWAKWESDGGVSAGTGGDETMIQMIAKAEETADEIMNAVFELRAELGLVDILQSGGMTEKEIRQFIERFEGGFGDQYLKTWDQDYDAMEDAALKILEELDGTQKENEQDRIGKFFDDLNTLRYSLFNQIGDVVRDAKNIEPLLDQIESDLSARNNNLKTATNQMAEKMGEIDFALDTLASLSDDSYHGIQQSATISYTMQGGVRSPNIMLNSSAQNQNQRLMQEIQKSFLEWQPTIDRNVQKILQGRKQVFQTIGPGSGLSGLQESMNAPLITTKSDLMNAFTDLNTSYKTMYTLYGNIPAPWDADYVYRKLATIKDHREISNARRIISLAMMSIPTNDLPTNPIDQYRVTGNMFYRVVPQVLSKYYLQKTDTLMFNFDAFYKVKQNSLDSLHQILTSNSDLLWDKYAQLSENLYALVKEYDNYLTLLDQSHYQKFKDSTQIWLGDLENQFVYPLTTASASVHATTGFEPAVLNVEWDADSEKQLSEIAVSYNGSPFQSAGHRFSCEREYMLKHGVSYFYENQDGAIVWPFTQEQQRKISITPRMRNRAGLAVTGSQLIAEISGKDWKYKGGANTVKPTLDGKDMFSCVIDFPYKQVISNRKTIFLSNRTDELIIRWSLDTNYGLSNYNPAPARHIVEIKQGDRTVYGPKTFTVAEQLGQRRYQLTLDDVSLTPDSGQPFSVFISQQDIAGTRISETKDDETPPLFITTKPPVIRAECSKFQAAAGQPVRYKFYKARIAIDTPDGKLVTHFDTFDDYEYKLVPQGESADSIGWLKLSSSTLVSGLPDNVTGGPNASLMTNSFYTHYFLHFGSKPYNQSLTLWLRARHADSEWDTGYSEPVSFVIAKEKEYDDPVPAEFEVVGFDAYGNLQIEITKAGSDNQSGISHYGWYLHQDADEYNDAINIAQPDSSHYAPDQIRPGVALTIPIDDSVKDRLIKFDLSLWTIDRSGNKSMYDQTINVAPPVPKLSVKLHAGLHPYTLAYQVPLQPLKRKHVQKLVMHVGTTPDASDVGSDSVIVGDYPYASQKSTRGTIPLPDRITTGTTLYVSAFSKRGSLQSEPFRQRIDIYQEMFQTVETDSAGNLVIPITGKAFNGNREASFEYALGYHNTTNPQIASLQFSLQSWTSLEGIITDHVQPGKRLRLPFKAENAYATTLVALRATGLDGATHTTMQVVRIIPPRPELKINVTSNKSKNRFPAAIRARFGKMLQQGAASVLIKIGERPGDDSVFRHNLKVLPTGEWSRLGFSLPFSIANFDQIAVTAHAKTGAGVKSTDSTVVWVDVPDMPIFEFVSFGYDPAGHPVIKPTLLGFDSLNIAGYQYAFGSVDAAGYDLRPFPQDLSTFDFSTNQWQIGEPIVIPEDILDLDIDQFKVGIRVISKQGETKESQHVTHQYLRPAADVAFVRNGQQLQFSGELSPAMIEQMATRELRISLRLNESIIQNIDVHVGQNNRFQNTVWVAQAAPYCQTFEFWCSFFNSQHTELSVFKTAIKRPCDPIIRWPTQLWNDQIRVTIHDLAFGGQRTLAGYQFAVLSVDGQTAYRPYPAEGIYDFTPAQVIRDSSLVLPTSLAGLPGTVQVGFKGVDVDGFEHSSSVNMNVCPQVPAMTSLEIGEYDRLFVELDENTIDQKTNQVHMVLKRGWSDYIANRNVTLYDDQFSYSMRTDIRESDLGKVREFKIFAKGKTGSSFPAVYDVTITRDGDGYHVEWQANETWAP